jgi:hypothetical protein
MFTLLKILKYAHMFTIIIIIIKGKAIPVLLFFVG